MTIPAWLLAFVLWLSVAGVAAGGIYLVVVLIVEWRKGALW